MANTWLLQTFNVTTSTSTPLSMCSLWNPTGSGKIYKIYRVWIAQAHHVAAQTAALYTFELRRFSALPTLTTTNALLTPYDNANSLTVPTNISYGYTTGTTATTDSSPGLFRKYIMSVNEQASTVGASIDAMSHSQLSHQGILFIAGSHNNSVVEPIIVNPNEGIYVKAVTNSAVGRMDVCMEFTE